MNATAFPDPYVAPIESPKISVPEAYFDSARQLYLIKDSRGGWVSINETQLKRHLRASLRDRRNQDEVLSPLEAHLNTIQLEKNVSFAGPLAGTSAGEYEYEGKRILVTDSPRIISPAEGSWNTLRVVIENLLIDEYHDQTPYFYGWMKLAREGLITGSKRPGQALVFAGPRDCGKSLLQNLITPLLGGRAAKPYGWMIGATDFNAELFGSEHLVIEDEAASSELRARRSLGAALKGITVNTVQKYHAKGRTAMSLEPFWRASITVNDEPENLMVLPPLDESLEDKVILLRANKRPMPMPTCTTEERAAFRAQLLSELPAFCGFLEQWRIPEQLASQRFGIRHYHHPELLRAIDDLTPENRLWQLVEAEILHDCDQWTGSSVELEHALTSNNASTTYEARRLFTFNTACGVYLARLESKRPQQVSSARSKTGTTWTLRRRAGERV